MAEQKATIGRIVHYVFDNALGERVERPAIIVRVWEPGDTVQLQVFTDDANDGEPGVIWRTSVIHNETEKAPSTWHWPERD